MLLLKFSKEGKEFLERTTQKEEESESNNIDEKPAPVPRDNTMEATAKVLKTLHDSYCSSGVCRLHKHGCLYK